MRVEVRPGEGGADAEAFADMCFEAVLATIRRKGLTAEDVQISDRIRTAYVEGDATWMRQIVGTHRVQRIPKGSASRHTSTATIVALEDALVSTS